ncbi:CAP domain-containing protein [bacterium]|nr:CAP domain-containing protein [bacterium]
MVRSFVLAVGLLTCLVPALPAQNSPSDDSQLEIQPSSTLLSRLKFSRIRIEDARLLAEALAGRKTRDRLYASKLLKGHYTRYAKVFDKLTADVIGAVESTAKKSQQRLLGKKGKAEVDLLRAESLAVSRQRGLTKEQIRQDVDPRMDRLRELLFPSFASVLALNPRLDSKLLELRSNFQQLRDWHEIYATVVEGLEMHEDAAKHFVKYPPPEHPGDDQRIDQAIAFALFGGLPMTNSDRKVLKQNEAIRGSAPVQEYLGTLRLNEIRYLLGLGLVAVDEKLSDAARDHSKDMQVLGFFSHTSPVPGKERFGQRAAKFGTSAGAENIAAGQSKGQGAIRAWWYSPGHHRNMLGGHRRTGLGQYQTMWTQMFGG